MLDGLGEKMTQQCREYEVKVSKLERPQQGFGRSKITCLFWNENLERKKQL